MIKCQGCDNRKILMDKYTLELRVIFEKNQIDQATSTLICTNVSNWLKGREPVTTREIAPDASKTLIKAGSEQIKIGWEHWMKGRWSSEWSNLFNYDIKHNNSGIKYNSPEKIAKEIITLTWEYIYQCWVERNKKEHEDIGEKGIRKKEKIVEIILGESGQMEEEVYKENELVYENLIKLPIENLQMIEINLKNVRKRRRKGRTNMLHK
jgi:hypothetical protein